MRESEIIDFVLKSSTIKSMKGKKYKSKEGVFYWAENFSLQGGAGQKHTEKEMWHVVSKVPGYPETEAFKDWFPKKEDAEDIAKQLSLGKI